MSRRRTKTPAAVTYDVPWTERIAALFDLAQPDWTPPSTVRVRRHVRNFSVTAIFAAPTGRVTARARVSQSAAGGWVQTSEDATFHLGYPS